MDNHVLDVLVPTVTQPQAFLAPSNGKAKARPFLFPLFPNSHFHLVLWHGNV